MRQPVSARQQPTLFVIWPWKDSRRESELLQRIAAAGVQVYWTSFGTSSFDYVELEREFGSADAALLFYNDAEDSSAAYEQARWALDGKPLFIVANRNEPLYPLWESVLAAQTHVIWLNADPERAAKTVLTTLVENAPPAA